jgi:hypothetical protein
MGAVTYPNIAVAAILSEIYVPVQINLDGNVAKLIDQYQVMWTPNINILSHRGQLICHIEGWQSPSEFQAWLTLGQGHYHLHRKDFEAAVAHFEKTFEHYPQSEWAPEALYYVAVCKYLASHDGNKLFEGWGTLRRYYPHSAWSMRANV